MEILALKAGVCKGIELLAADDYYCLLLHIFGMVILAAVIVHRVPVKSINHSFPLLCQTALPVLESLKFHEFHVVAEEDAPLIINTSHPDRKWWIFQS